MKQPAVKWTFEACRSEALRFNARSRWGTGSPRSYVIAQKRGWLGACCAHMKPLYVHHTLERCKESAKKFTTRTEWQRADPVHANCYNAALRHGWLEDCCAHMDSDLIRDVRYRVYAIIFSEKRAYVGITRNPLKTRLHQHFSGRFKEHRDSVMFAWSIYDDLAPTDAQKHERLWIETLGSSGYSMFNLAAAGSLGPEPEARSAIIDRLRHSALKYGARSDWYVSEPGNYSKAASLGLLDELCSHMSRKVKYTKEACLAAAAECSNLKEFRERHKRHYFSAYYKGWLNETKARLAA